MFTTALPRASLLIVARLLRHLDISEPFHRYVSHTDNGANCTQRVYVLFFTRSVDTNFAFRHASYEQIGRLGKSTHRLLARPLGSITYNTAILLYNVVSLYLEFFPVSNTRCSATFLETLRNVLRTVTHYTPTRLRSTRCALYVRAATWKRPKTFARRHV